MPSQQLLRSRVCFGRNLAPEPLPSLTGGAPGCLAGGWVSWHGAGLGSRPPSCLGSILAAGPAKWICYMQCFDRIIRSLEGKDAFGTELMAQAGGRGA